MKRYAFPLFLLSVLFTACNSNENKNEITVVASDVQNFWKAYDLVTSTPDSASQAEILEREFFAPGTPGLAAIMGARRYTKEEYRQSINAYPKFWRSMRENMLKAPDLAGQIKEGGEKFFSIYPQQLPAEVYFTVGCFRTNGTIVDSLLLIGTELALAGPGVDLSEWPERMDGLRPYMESSPMENLVFLNTHEFVHTQQPSRQGYNLLGQSIFEGVPEFMATLALEQASTTPAIAYGKANEAKVKAAFARDMGAEYFDKWTWDADNQFGIRDLVYYIGFDMVEQYYKAAQDKQAAIKNLVEMDYNNPATVNQFVDQLGYFDRPVNEYLTQYEARRPSVTHLSQFENNATNVDPNLKEITFHFSKPLNTYFKNTDFGPLGEDYVPKIEGATTAEDGLSITYQVNLDPGKKYQFTLGSGYRMENGIRLVPYTLTFVTH
ncbi:Ig-like domain-containing protein [Neolewinella persica]|uniref:Ig-like domain-containing protein n=1 Tax=Neolewinella persica TaxID=70998 RepID=UPI00036B0295|nr:Ig-like domain-containing protein [Neolewinella persica]